MSKEFGSINFSYMTSTALFDYFQLLVQDISYEDYSEIYRFGHDSECDDETNSCICYEVRRVRQALLDIVNVGNELKYRFDHRCEKICCGTLEIFHIPNFRSVDEVLDQICFIVNRYSQHRCKFEMIAKKPS